MSATAPPPSPTATIRSLTVGVVLGLLAVVGVLLLDQGRTVAFVSGGIVLVAASLVAYGVVTRPRGAWRTVDIVTAAVLAVACGVVFRAWSALWEAVAPAFTGFPPGQAVMYGMWFLAAALVPMIVRKPGAALFAELVGSVLEWVLLSQFGATVIVYGVVQGLCAEAVWAGFRYRRWGLVPAALAGAAAGVGAALLDFAYYYSAWSGGWKLVYVILVPLSGAVLTGGLSWWLVRALAPTGALNAFAAGRRRELV